MRVTWSACRLRSRYVTELPICILIIGETSTIKWRKTEIDTSQKSEMHKSWPRLRSRLNLESAFSKHKARMRIRSLSAMWSSSTYQNKTNSSTDAALGTSLTRFRRCLTETRSIRTSATWNPFFKSKPLSFPLARLSFPWAILARWATATWWSLIRTWSWAPQSKSKKASLDLAKVSSSRAQTMCKKSSAF